MTQSLTEHIQSSRLVVVEVKRAEGRLRVRGEADVCAELSCSEETLVVTDEDAKAGLDTLHPGDIIKIEPAGGRPDRIVLLRRAWDELASPEV
ncbi:MAG: hypothetical protein AUH77_10485 [Candidatus Rokubacteria bacterium 13_1_40CM_4_69_39]|jgi:hypothetical protein|nr:MAG: hypothetical protein AUH09_08715 [Candidatus Rokubacteria bacterium 13_2_20CM_70_12]OLC53353.1 MAG: hypothetical protein AUH77_10485 [Candidatus Rokubacteria bacterium 13_1_40CM_4_69_39]OLD69105.1 MAG: hypothetical protein AUF63_01410 [Candidatus Rokubacteria bacterium 13_1_20CM_70_15]OLD77741.1 MAG: hypothetical protein AUG87_03495 [Candidatus Rokubacteria bacterium 13_1_20CM_4_70_14]PYM48612.1 MAG: hypothetical protein DME14_11145 [Candidatus Rokubacteria bacterium]